MRSVAVLFLLALVGCASSDSTPAGAIAAVEEPTVAPTAIVEVEEPTAVPTATSVPTPTPEATPTPASVDLKPSPAPERVPEDEFREDPRVRSLGIYSDEEGNAYLNLVDMSPSSTNCSNAGLQTYYVYVEGDGGTSGTVNGIELGEPACGYAIDSSSIGHCLNADKRNSVEQLRPPLAIENLEGDVEWTFDIACVTTIGN